ncbi:MAG TPA: hypothetical protein VN043_17490 [Rhodanobacter sp.]|nr:hypothetical protein [Rhodanobacter sp.]
MTVSYANYQYRAINELVFAGTHDAGINTGGSNEKTQNLDIAGQAGAGARIFDLRIASRSSGLPGSGKLKAYHGKGMHKVLGGNQLMAGTWGEGLSGMLADARRFVARKSSEFLFLKFDHCSNWDQIAAMCVDVLGPSIYTGGGNLNTKSAGELAGKVIVLFSGAGLQKIGGVNPGAGILGIKSLYEKGATQKAYDPAYIGLQYHGKGGTSAMNGKADNKKLAENVKKQTTIIDSGRRINGGDPMVMGMMYWTTTGLFRNIKSRDQSNWSSGGFSDGMKRLWLEGMGEYIDDNLPLYITRGAYGTGPMMKRFMPNFVMIDFADAPRCQAIFDLNQLAGTSLVEAAVNLGAVSPGKYQEGLRKVFG